MDTQLIHAYRQVESEFMNASSKDYTPKEFFKLFCRYTGMQKLLAQEYIRMWQKEQRGQAHDLYDSNAA